MTVISSTSNLLAYSQPLPFALLRPKHCPPRTHLYTGTDLYKIWDYLEQGGVVALDFETRGVDATLPDNYVVGMGLAGRGFRVYLHRIGNEEEFDHFLSEMLKLNTVQWIAHNVNFDGQWIYHMFGKHLSWYSCTYALYRHTATEGWPGQKFSLKDAMVQLLQWPDANTARLDQWLRDNGHINQAHNIQYGEMWRAPAGILGEYCALDAEATYLLYTEILEPVLNRFPELRKYHTGPFMRMLLILIEQRLIGMLIDRDKLQAAHDEISSELAPVEKWLREESVLAPHIRRWQDEAMAEFIASAPKQYLTQKASKEPSKYTKNGKVSKTWLNWKEKGTTEPKLSKNWIKWKEKEALVLSGEDTRCVFNLRSGDQLRWLFFEAMGYTPTEFTTGDIPIPRIDSETLRQYGEGGAALETLLLLHKEHSFTTKYLELTESRNTIHAGFRVPGTLTGRLSGTEPNLQQVPKSRRFLDSMVARPGHVWIDADFSALEPVVTAEFSGDPTLMAIYGPKADPGADIYLHTGAGIPALSAAIRASGYIPENGITTEIAAHTKRVCKRERSICKTLYLGANYGAGAGKIHKTLLTQGVEISFEEVQTVHRQFWELYSGIKRFEWQLKDQWRKNGGWILNGIGRPLGIHKDYTKDIVNRFSQSTGHDILVMYIELLDRALRENGLEYTPIVINFHDESIIEVREEDAQKAIDIFIQANVELNRVLSGSIPLKINPIVARCLSDAKLE